MSVSAISFSIAWYASATELKVEGIELSYDTDVELEISTSTDPETFKSRLEKSETAAVRSFLPVSGMWQEKWIPNKESKPSFYDCTNPLVPNTGIPYQFKATSGFYQQSLYLKASRDVYASVDGLGSFIRSNQVYNEETAKRIAYQYPDLTVDEIVANLNRLVNAMRISILVPDEENYAYYVIDPCKEGTTVFAGPLDNDNDGYYDTFLGEGNSRYEVCYGSVKSRSNLVYLDPVEEDIVSPIHNAFEADHKAGAYRLDLESSLENDIDAETERSYTFLDIEKEEYPDSIMQIPCYAGEPREIVVSIYLEGWDRDCINPTMGACFIAELSFKVLGGII